MIFKCKNCGGNSIYNPETKHMYCPHCESEDSQEKLEENDLLVCGNCGAPLDVKEHTSAMRCENCGSYHVFEERISGEYTPHLILPFQISKKQAEEILRKEFRRRTFAPASFLSHASIEKMEGSYVPFFLYDYHVRASYRAKGTKVRTWSSGDYRYKETSFYAIARDMDVNFDNIPVDASVRLDDKVMDLLEPYDYKALEEFKDQYMSGFEGETYSETKEVLQARAEEKVRKDSGALLRDSIVGYTAVIPEREEVGPQLQRCDYALLPVWIYDFLYQQKSYRFYVNGQTGKVIGEAPIAYKKAAGYGATVFALSLAAGFLIRTLLLLL